MLGRLAMIAALVALSACAGVESAGRTASRTSQPAPVSRPAQQPTQQPTQQPAPSAPALAPPQQAAPAPRAAAPQASPALTLPPASVAAPTPEPQPIEAPSVAAPEVRVPTPTAAPPRPRSDDDDIVVPGQAQEQVVAPRGDFRSREQRNEDIRAWDQCVSAVQAVYERDPMRPQLDSPEDYCARSLGMANRDAIPESRLQRVRR